VLLVFRLGRDEARLVGLDRVGYRTLIRWEVRCRRYGAVESPAA
jgi:hypothetical protein